jgi:hypothetical protein
MPGIEVGSQTLSPAVRSPPVQRLEVRPPHWAVRPPHPCRSFVVCFAKFGRAHDFGCAQRGALNSTCVTHGHGVYNHSRTTSGSGALPAPLLASPSGCARATITASTSAVAAGEGCTGGTFGQSSSNDHAGKAELPADRLTLASTVLLVLYSVCAALIDLNWRRAMQEEFAVLIANNT